jgi:sphinganine C4-monooxygenase
MSLISPADIALIDSAVSPPVRLSLQSGLIDGLSDGVLALIAPLVAYWGYSMYFHIIDVFQLLEKYRIHPSEEQLSKNKVTQFEVVRDVIFQHIIQTITGYILHTYEPPAITGYENQVMWTWRHSSFMPTWIPTSFIYLFYWYGLSLLKIAVAFLMVDTWQFFLHMIMHKNKTLYRTFHARHHQLYVPYAFGALFNNPVEGFLLDTLGTGLTALMLSLSARETVFLYTFSTMKTVDDHCGYALPWDIFQRIFPNNSIYHDIHHQMFGIKYNFSQPFFVFWDTLCGTTYHGIDEYKAKQKEITIAKYKQFLKERKEKNKAATTTDTENKKEL